MAAPTASAAKEQQTPQKIGELEEEDEFEEFMNEGMNRLRSHLYLLGLVIKG
jgi:hypothetical protein